MESGIVLGSLVMTYGYASARIIFGSSILGFGFYSSKIELGKNRIGFKSNTVWVGFGLSIFSSLQIGSLWIGFKLGRIILDAGHFNSYYNSGFVWLWINLLRMFGSKSVQPISGVGSGMDSGQSVRVSDLGLVLPGLLASNVKVGIIIVQHP